MMAVTKCGLLFLFASLAMFSDTITKTDDLSYNGSIKGMVGGELKLEAHFRDGVKTLVVKESQLYSIEFNDETFNSGPPPKALGARPGTDTPPPSAPRPVDKVVFRGGEQKSCELLGIDAQFVHCSGADFGRDTVSRVLIHR